ncbi:ATP-binding protein [Ferrimonas balearica]|uniref:ATP-binding protein n=1 Tax=Ferrimonas balearica TaxID=44012 RepID=UPI001C9962E2|nr:ATP-binding protein [Ferrimonas balearica]MBY5922886.1 hypothetical protein [Ferrimonas balearica]MBY5997737.1 hypothetical protein [Ferrimonas balearica]
MRSIRATILTGFTLLVLLTNGLGLLGSYMVAKQEQQSLVDASLAQRARVTLRLLEEYPSESGKDLVDWAMGALIRLGMDQGPDWALSDATLAGKQTMWMQVWINGRCYAPFVDAQCDPNNSLTLGESGFDDQPFAGETWRTFSVYSVHHDAWVQTAFPRSIASDLLAQRMREAWGMQMLILTPLTLLFSALIVAMALRPLRELAGKVSDDNAVLPEPSSVNTELRPIVTELRELRERAIESRIQQTRLGNTMAQRCQAQVDGVVMAIAEGPLGQRRARYHLEKLEKQLLQARLWLILSRPGEPEVAPQDLYRKASLSVARHYGLARRKNCRLVLRGMDRGMLTRIPEVALRGLLDALIDNALRYSPPDSEVLVNLRREGKGRAWVTVSDAGPGLTPQQLSNAPDLTLAASWHRSGLGLGIVSTVAKRYGLSVEVSRSQLYGGTKVRVGFPIERGIAHTPNYTPAMGQPEEYV